jgi:hypothetical protein
MCCPDRRLGVGPSRAGLVRGGTQISQFGVGVDGWVLPGVRGVRVRFRGPEEIDAGNAGWLPAGLLRYVDGWDHAEGRALAATWDRLPYPPK